MYQKERYQAQLEQLKSVYHQRLGAKQTIESAIAQSKVTLEQLEASSGDLVKALDLLSAVSREAREQAKMHLESIVTEALQFISSGDYKFIIELGESGGKPTCEFLVESEVNGEISRQKPESACGGGFVDIISTTLRYAYLKVFSDPTIKSRTIILDEPGKMISEQASVRFSEFVKYLGTELDKQTIMITHNDTLMSAADKTYVVTNYQGLSKAMEAITDVQDDFEI